MLTGYSESQLREPGYDCCSAVLNLGQIVFILHCSCSHCFMNEYLATDSGWCLSEHLSHINCSVAECFQEKLSLSMLEQVWKGSIKLFEQLFGNHSTILRSVHKYALNMPTLKS